MGEQRSRVQRLADSGIVGVALISAIAVILSEAFYWYAGGTDYPTRVLFYTIPTTALLWTAQRFGVGGWPAILVTGAVYGFVTEGVLTPVMYGAFPFDPFALSYTSLAWHAVVTVAFGLVLVRRLLSSGSWIRAAAALALFGAFWGLWARGLELPDGPNADGEGIAPFLGTVSVPLFAAYTVAVTGAFALFHALLGRVVRVRHLRPGPVLTRTVLVLGTVYFAVFIVIAAPWAPLVLAVVLWTCRWALVRLATEDARPLLLDDLARPIPWHRLVLLGALPIAAVAVYGVLQAAPLSDSLALDLCVNLVVAVQAVVGWGFFGWALVRARRAGRRAASASTPGMPKPDAADSGRALIAP